MSQKEGQAQNVRTDLQESYQPAANKTYSPKVRSARAMDSYTPVLAAGNYQPVLPVTTEQPTPPTGGSGMPAANRGSKAPAESSANDGQK